MCYDNPQNHPLISRKEREYIKLKTADYLEAEKKNLPPAPWVAIFTSIPVLTLLASIVRCNINQLFPTMLFTNTLNFQSLATVSSYIVNISLTKYLNDVLHIPIERNSIYSTVPHIVTIFISILTGFMGDWMHVNCKISLTNVRKAFAFLCES